MSQQDTSSSVAVEGRLLVLWSLDNHLGSQQSAFGNDLAIQQLDL